MQPDSFHLAAGDGDEDFRQGRASSDAAPSAFTPGPWHVRTLDGSRWTIDAAGDLAVAQAQQCRPLRADQMQMERTANARLIAAAPEFYVGAQHLMDYEAAMEADDHIGAMQHYADAVDTLRSAIAKALGTPDSASGSPASQGQSQVNKETP